MSKSMRGVWLLALLFGGCGGTTSPSAGVTAEQACSEAAAVICERQSVCTPLVFTVGYGDTANCTALFRQGCLRNLAANGTSQTPAALSACAASARALSCDALRAGDTPAGCATAPGSLANGAACFVDAQCASTFCVIGSGTCGTCQALPTAGGPCASNHSCGPGLVCTSASTCVAPGRAGSACTVGTSPCGGGLNCVSGTCRAAVSMAGAACDAMNSCDLAAGLVCDATRVCARVTTAAAGQACGAISGGYVLCANGSCPGLSSMARMGACQAYAADGAPCNEMTGPNCRLGSQCVPTNGMSGAGTCQQPGQTACM